MVECVMFVWYKWMGRYEIGWQSVKYNKILPCRHKIVVELGEWDTCAILVYRKVAFGGLGISWHIYVLSQYDPSLLDDSTMYSPYTSYLVSHHLVSRCVERLDLILGLQDEIFFLDKLVVVPT